MIGRPTLTDRVAFFAPAFRAGPAPLYEYLTLRAAVELEEPTNPLTRSLEPFVSERPERFLWLRLLALVHRWVLAGELPELAGFYPSAGGTEGPSSEAWDLFRTAVLARAGELPELLTKPLQHNEVGRAAALATGFLLLSRETGLPLRLLEVGASAGLLLRWDHYLRSAWFPSMFDGDPPAVAGQARVVERRGCDLHPVDATSVEGRLYLRSMAWADLVTHLQALDEAIAICRQVPAEVDEADGAEWVAKHARPQAGTVTAIFHSLMRASGPPSSLVSIDEAIWQAARTARTDAPVAHLRFEAPVDVVREVVDPTRLVEVRLTVWPGGEHRRLATCDVNGRHVRWLL